MGRASVKLFVMAALLAAAAACGANPDRAPSQKAALTASAGAAPAQGDAAVTSEAIKSAPANAPVVVMLGDSLTAGYQLAPTQALPAAVDRLLDAHGVPANVINAGVSGDTTADGLNRYDFSVAAAKPDILVIALGANDYLNQLPPANARKNLAAIIERAKKNGVQTALVGIRIPEGAHPSPAELAYAAIYPDLAKTYSIPLYGDMLGPISGKPQFLLSDGLHPTPEGVELMAAPIEKFLEPIIKAVAAGKR